MSLKPIVNLRAVNFQKRRWTIDENGISSQALVVERHEFQFQREGSDEWIPFEIVFTVPDEIED